MPDKVIHEIRLNQYIALPADRTRRFSLGTRDSYGVEQLRIVPGEGWDGLTITATFHPPEGEAVQVIVPADGLIDVPPEATRSGSELPIRYGKIVFAGVADGVQRISCNLPYTVMDHAPVDGAASSGPSPSWYEQATAHFLPDGGKAGQVLAKASDADLDVEWADGGGSGTSDHAKLSNRDAADQHTISAITGLQKELDGKQPTGDYLTADSLQAATDAALAQAKASGEFDGADGAPGKDGADGQPGENGITPTIGANGNWYLGETDTGKPSRGETGPKGEKGEKGDTGDTGPAGPKGDTGATGPQGIQGPVGPQGPQGEQGPQGIQGETGPTGADGKSAYQYAQEGGYTGTETEFAAKLAQEVPTTLPNPNKLILSGAVTAEYDGSSTVSVEIPSGGGSAYELPVASPTALGGVKAVAATDDMTDNVGITAEGLLKVKPGGESGFVVVVDETVTLDGTGAALEFDIKTGVKSCVLYIDSKIDSVASSDKIKPTIDGHGVMNWFDQLNLSTALCTGQTFYWPGVGSAPIVFGIKGGDSNGLGMAFRMVRGNISVCYNGWGGRTGKLRIEVPAKAGQMKIECYAKY